MPAEWEPHRATWIAWPHHEPDWPGKFAPIPWVYAEIVRVLVGAEPVEILCPSDDARASAEATLAAHGVAPARVRLHVTPTDRVWLRDSAPTGVLDADGRVVLLNWAFNAWAKYDNWQLDIGVGAAISHLTGLTRVEPRRADAAARVVLEGGGIEVNGGGALLVTEEWLLSDVQVRNPGLNRQEYEAIFREWLGADRTIWLGQGCVGDDTHGHVDDIARFVGRDTVVLAVEEDPSDENHRSSLDNLRRLELAAAPEPLRVVRLPFPRPVTMNGERLPASYANFYIANGVVLVPTFNDPNDRVALNTLAELMPAHQVVGIHAVDLLWGLGTLHCLTQQEPAARGLDRGSGSGDRRGGRDPGLGTRGFGPRPSYFVLEHPNRDATPASKRLGGSDARNRRFGAGRHARSVRPVAAGAVRRRIRGRLRQAQHQRLHELLVELQRSGPHGH